MRNVEIARVFQDIADLLEMKGENTFKIQAYRKAARAIDCLPREVETYLDEGLNLKSIPGVGDAIAKKTSELVTTGHLKYYEKLRQDFPEGILELLAIPGVGPRTAYRMSTGLGVTGIEQLERAIAEGRVVGLSGLGNKTAESILHEVQARRRQEQRTPPDVAQASLRDHDG